MHQRSRAVLGITTLLAGFACSGGTGGDGTAPAEDAADTAAAAEVVGGGDAEAPHAEVDAAGPVAFPTLPPADWQPCAALTDGVDTDAECASFQVPLFWDEPGGATTPLFVKRFRSAGASQGQLWLLPRGHPGNAGTSVEEVARLLVKLLPTLAGVALDGYVPDRRGTGRSARLGCPAEEGPDGEHGYELTDAEFAACWTAVRAAWGDDLVALSTTESARDLAALIETQRRPDDRVFVYGAMYGAYELNRYLQLFGDGQLTGLIYDNLYPPGLTTPQGLDVSQDATGEQRASLCDADPECAARLGGDAWAAIGARFAALAAGHCAELDPERFDAVGLQRLLGGFSYVSVGFRVLPYVIAYRLARCDVEDRIALRRISDVMFDPQRTPTRYYSEALATYLMLSEWVPPGEPLTLADAEATLTPLRHTNGLTLRLAERAATVAPYDPGQLWGKWAAVDVPMLVLQGTWGVPVAWAEAAAQRYAGPHQTLVELPGVFADALTEPDGTLTPACGVSIALSFLGDPTGPLDLSCVDLLPDQRMEPMWPTYTKFALGTDDLWDNGTPISELPKTDCVEESGVHATRSSTPNSVHVANRSSQPLDLFELDEAGTRHWVEVLYPGFSWVVSTYVTHPLVVADSEGQCVGIYIPTEGNFSRVWLD